MVLKSKLLNSYYAIQFKGIFVFVVDYNIIKLKKLVPSNIFSNPMTIDDES